MFFCNLSILWTKGSKLIDALILNKLATGFNPREDRKWYEKGNVVNKKE